MSAERSLFVIAADPLLRMLASAFPEATIKAFADDIVGVFKQMANLTKLEKSLTSSLRSRGCTSSQQNP